MNRTVKYRLSFFYLLITFYFLSLTSSWGCTTPVFRYALEMWPAFQYTAEIVHNGNLSEEQKQALELLKGTSKNGLTLNLKIIEIIEPENQNKETSQIPQIRLFYPVEHRNPKVLWQGALTGENASKIIDSPARREIVNKIKKGDAITWILLESDDKVKNDVAFKTLDSELTKLSKELKLAKTATDVNGNLLDIDVINRGVQFSMVKVSRNDPAEEIFVKMLLGTEPDLPYVKAPLAFPVFGRGRVLYALVGKGINKKLIKETCNSVIGWCSCTIKEDNPGADLLFEADWEKAIGDSTWVQEVELPEITGMSGFVQDEALDTIEDKTTTNSNSEIIEREESSVNVEEKVEMIEYSKDTSENIVKVHKEKEFQANVTESRKNTISPLLRNIGIVILFLLVLLPTVSFYVRKKRSNN